MSYVRRSRIAVSLVRGAIFLVALVAVCAPPLGAARAAAVCSDELVGRVPTRPQWSLDGSRFLHWTAGLSERDREFHLAQEMLVGNLPGFLRRLRPVTLEGRLPGGETAEVTICVMPDYLALGSDDDFVRMPMALPTALALAERFGFVLPTPKMVDAIYAQASVRLQPQPLPPTDSMRSNGYYWWHQDRIRQQRLERHVRLGTLIGGHKKDLVVTNRLREHRGRVAIYGWHRGQDDPIQPLSTVHGIRYADYSHGVRLVSAVAYVDGVPRSILDVLQDPWLARLLSDEGPIPGVGALIPASAKSSANVPSHGPIPSIGFDWFCAVTTLC